MILARQELPGRYSGLWSHPCDRTPDFIRGYDIISLYLISIRINPLFELRLDTVHNQITWINIIAPDEIRGTISDSFTLPHQSFRRQHSIA